MMFKDALEEAKKGKRIAHDSWSVTGTFVYYVHEALIHPETTNVPALQGFTHPVKVVAHLDMFTPQGDIQVGWRATGSDLHSNNWRVVE